MSEENQNKAREMTLEEKRLELGQEVQSLREKKSYSLEKLSDKTKIPCHILEKLETGHPDFYKEKLYSRGFLSLICKELESDFAPFLSKLEECQKEEKSTVAFEIDNPGSLEAVPTGQKTLFARKSLLFSLLVLALLFGSFFYQRLSHSNKKPPNISEHREDSSDVVQNKTNEPLLPDCHKHIPSELSHNKNLKCLSLLVKAPVNISTRIDSRNSKKESYKRGVFHFFYKDSCDFAFSDASLVEIILDGKNIGALSQKKEEKSFHLEEKTSKKHTPSS